MGRVILFLCLLLVSRLSAEELTIPRTVAILYDGKVWSNHLYYSKSHNFVEMPLNHLGLVCRYYDIRDGLPDVIHDEDVRAILTCFSPATTLKDPVAYLRWATRAVEAGKKIIILDAPAFYQDAKENITPTKLINRLLAYLGIEATNEWVNPTYTTTFPFQDPSLTPFERSYTGIIPAYRRMQRIDPDTQVHLIARQGEDPSTDTPLVVTSKNGAFASEGLLFLYAFDREWKREYRQWYINPFRFLELACDTVGEPKPDTTTLAGRRLYYSHIDCDGWQNATQIERYRDEVTLSAQVVMDQVIKPYPNLPVTVAPIAAELDPEWVGTELSQSVARELLALDHVEVGSHTYSHPFFWRFFEKGNFKKKERPFLPFYSSSTWEMKKQSGWKSFFGGKNVRKHSEGKTTELPKGYSLPRAYATCVFDLDKEIEGSAEYIRLFVPEDKPVTCLTWSGDTMPFEKAVKKVREAGMFNINGGDTRFDQEFPSCAWVFPLGLQIGKERTTYSSNSNENTYTKLWTGRYHGFQYLTTTLRRTESPVRLKPINLYYHMYSGEREASLDALLRNLEYIQKQEICPITASHFSAIVEGFFSVRLVKEKREEDAWRVEERGELQTIRFDRAAQRAVDWDRSRGIVGQRHHQGSLYVYLDKTESAPVVALQTYEELWEAPKARQPYLIESRWPIWGVERDGDNGCVFETAGFGEGEMTWKVPSTSPFSYTVTMFVDSEETASFVVSPKEGVLSLALTPVPKSKMKVKVVMKKI